MIFALGEVKWTTVPKPNISSRTTNHNVNLTDLPYYLMFFDSYENEIQINRSRTIRSAFEYVRTALGGQAQFILLVWHHQLDFKPINCTFQVKAKVKRRKLLGFFQPHLEI